LSEQELVAVGPGPFKMPSLTCAFYVKLRPQAVLNSSVMYAHPRFFEEEDPVDFSSHHLRKRKSVITHWAQPALRSVSKFAFFIVCEK
jgi:hypothetical protein